MDSKSLKRRSDGEEYIYPTKKQRIALYLDDYTPVRTIEVTNIDDNICRGYLQAYFECKIGFVSDVTIVNRKSEENQETRVGYVTFVVSEDAAKAICDSDSQLNCKFNIKQAEDSYQPKINPNALKFEEIPDDCLLRIASFLNLIDKINLGETSCRFKLFAKLNIYRKKTQFAFGHWTDNSDLSINKKNLPTILREMGQYFKTLQWVRLNDRQLDQVSQYCKGVTALYLMSPNLHLKSIQTEKNQLWFKNIESLKIEDADFYDDHFKAVTTTSTHLKSLQLIDCCNVRGNFFTEWKNSQLDTLGIIRCQGIASSNITDFQRKHNLIKFSSDTFDSFITCLSLPTARLCYYAHLELVVSSSTDEKLHLLKFDELTQLQIIHLKCIFYNDRVGRDATVLNNFNNVFAAMSPIQSLNSLSVEHIIIDADTFQCLGSIQNLQEINLKNYYNVIGNEMYSSLQAHLPKLVKLSMKEAGTKKDAPIDVISIRDMVSGLVDLKYFSHSSMTWELLDLIRDAQLNRTQLPIEIGLPQMLFHSPKKADFDAVNNGAVILSLAIK